MKTLVVSLLLVLLCAWAAPGCGGNGGTSKEAELPILEVGDKWVYQWVTNTTQSTCTMEMKGEDTVNGKDCYVLQLSFDPPLSPGLTALCGGCVSDGTQMLDKANCLLLEMKGTCTKKDTKYTVVSTHTYTFESPLWPLKLDKQVDVSNETDKIVVTVKSPTTEGTCEDGGSGDRVYKVEAVEQITVAAGTFECFRVVRYDGYGNKERTFWYSETVKKDVKWIDHESGDSAELKSYSV